MSAADTLSDLLALPCLFSLLSRVPPRPRSHHPYPYSKTTPPRFLSPLSPPPSTPSYAQAGTSRTHQREPPGRDGLYAHTPENTHAWLCSPIRRHGRGPLFADSNIRTAQCTFSHLNGVLFGTQFAQFNFIITEMAVIEEVQASSDDTTANAPKWIGFEDT